MTREEAGLSLELDKICSEITATKEITKRQLKILKKQSKESLKNLYSGVYKRFESGRGIDELELNILNKIQSIVREVGESPKANLQFESEPKTDVEQCCREFYNMMFNLHDSSLIRSKLVAGTDMWSVLLDDYYGSVMEADKSFASVAPVLFRTEMTALRMELFTFALGCSKKVNTDKFTIPASFFTRSYLEEKGKLDIFNIMAEYNQAIARSAVMDANLKQYSGSMGNARVIFVNDLRSRMALKWVQEYVGDRPDPTEESQAQKIGCINMVANRLGADIEREDGVVVKSLCVRLAARLGCDVSLNSEALFRLSAILYGLYKGAEEYLESVDLRR